MFTRRQKLWAWMATLAIFAVMAVWQVHRLLPSWVARAVRGSLEEYGIVATQFPVKTVGPLAAQVGSGSLFLDANSLSWQQIEANYSPLTLFLGELESLTLFSPHLSLNMLAPVAAVGAAGGSQADSGLREQLLNLPLDRFEAVGGRLSFEMDGEAMLDTTLEARLERQPYGTSAEVSMAGNRLLAHLSMRVPHAQPSITFQANTIFPTRSLVELESDLTSHLPFLECAPQLLHSGQLFLDILVELPDAASGQASFQAMMEDALLRLPFLQADFALNNVVAGGTLHQNQLFAAGGFEFISPDLEGFRADPFTVNFRYDPVEGIHLETERFSTAAFGLLADGAVRGRLLPPDATRQSPSASVEWSLTRLTAPGFSAGAFSLLLASEGSDIRFSASPVGLEKGGTLWIEDLAGQLDASSRSGDFHFSWFSPSGASLGKVAGQVLTDGNTIGFAGRLIPADSSLPAEFSGRYDTEGPSRLQFAGDLQPDWFNSLMQWFQAPKAILSGSPVTCMLDVQGLFPFLWGSGMLEFKDSSLSLPGGASLQGIHGRTDFLINLLPRTEKTQSLSIDRLEHSSAVLTDIELDWALPNIQSLQIKRLVAQLEGSQLTVDPFELDPRSPNFQSTLRFRNIPARKLMEALKEKRFDLQGSVSGSISIGWNEGALVLGQGRLRLDDGAAGRFVFVDQDFLRERFSSFNGVPAELRERFLDTLLLDGIRIDALQAELGPAAEPGKVLMRIAIQGESRSERLQVPIQGFVINNLISLEDLAELLGLFAPIEVKTGQNP